MDFALSTEQQMLVESLRAFVEQELYPYEEEVEKAGAVRPELIEQIKRRAIEQGFYAANMPEEVGGAGLDTVTLALVERELGAASWALQTHVGRPSKILLACQGEQVERYLMPCVRGEKIEWSATSTVRMLPAPRRHPRPTDTPSRMITLPPTIVLSCSSRSPGMTPL